MRLTSLAALSASDLKLATAMSVEMLQDIDKVTIPSEAPSTRDPSPLINALLQRKGRPEELAAALANKKLPPDAAKVALRTLDASGRQIPALSEALTKAGGLTSGPRELSADEMQALVAEVTAKGNAKGNAHHGEAIYRRKELNCLKSFGSVDNRRRMCFLASRRRIKGRYREWLVLQGRANARKDVRGYSVVGPIPK